MVLKGQQLLASDGIPDFSGAITTSRFVLRMFASLAELERDNIVERTTAGRDARGRIDGERGGQIPMGFRRIFDERGNAVGVEVDRREANVVRDIFAWRAAGAGMLNIAKRLDGRAITTTRSRKWHASSVRAVLATRTSIEGAREAKALNDGPGYWIDLLEASWDLLGANLSGSGSNSVYNVPERR